MPVNDLEMLLTRAATDREFREQLVDNPELFNSHTPLSSNASRRAAEVADYLRATDLTDVQDLRTTLFERFGNTAAWTDGFADRYTDQYNDDG